MQHLIIELKITPVLVGIIFMTIGTLILAYILSIISKKERS